MFTTGVIRSTIDVSPAYFATGYGYVSTNDVEKGYTSSRNTSQQQECAIGCNLCTKICSADGDVSDVIWFSLCPRCRFSVSQDVA